MIPPGLHFIFTGTEFGVDYASWSTGPNFRGLKMIPPGLHFIFYSAVSKEGTVAPRTGFFYSFKEKEVSSVSSFSS